MAHRLASLAGLEACPGLQTLVATNCKLGPLEGLQPLLRCPAIQTLDLQGNEIKDGALLELLRAMPNLRCVRGAPCA